jgi:hypothetical protein
MAMERRGDRQGESTSLLPEVDADAVDVVKRRAELSISEEVSDCLLAGGHHDLVVEQAEPVEVRQHLWSYTASSGWVWTSVMTALPTRPCKARQR